MTQVQVVIDLQKVYIDQCLRDINEKRISHTVSATLTAPLTTTFRAPEKTLIPLMLAGGRGLSEGGKDMGRKKEATAERQD